MARQAKRGASAVRRGHSAGPGLQTRPRPLGLDGEMASIARWIGQHPEQWRAGEERAEEGRGRAGKRAGGAGRRAGGARGRAPGLSLWGRIADVPYIVLHICIGSEVKLEKPIQNWKSESNPKDRIMRSERTEHPCDFGHRDYDS